MTFKTAFSKVHNLIKENKNVPDKIGSVLVSTRIPHLSYSMISSYESCPQKYYLEYVKQVKLRPEPLYFAKGKALHTAAKNLYSRGLATGIPISFWNKMVHGVRETKDKKHLENAFNLMVKNRWDIEWEVIDIERPFVMQIHEELPPFFGIIDLVIRKGNQYIVVDHKTGNSFNEVDPKQLVLYREFVCQEYSAKKVDTYYDQYRWVNNLDRVKKPAFMRSKIPIKANDIGKAIARAKKAYTGLCKIDVPVDVAFSERCYSCQFRNLCF
jgi:CRISPR/Cas system-associated exonuclease Cas4 (RecB family)